ncbi:MAG: toll/interleukin-1 receptor domain-containing protein [Acidobacteriaceae bacterium]
MGGAIFVSYRRDDSEGEAGRLFDDLTRAFGQDCVFMDVAGIHPGMDFRKAIEDHVSSCGVLLAMIGPSWTNITNSSGQRRLDDPNDFVRIEVAAALARNIPVIPVLVHEARVPRPEQLPDNLKDLAWRNSVEITHARWNSDVQLLTQALQSYVTTAPDSALTDNQPVHANVPVQLPPPHPSPANGSAGQEVFEDAADRRYLRCGRSVGCGDGAAGTPQFGEIPGSAQRHLDQPRDTPTQRPGAGDYLRDRQPAFHACVGTVPACKLRLGCAAGEV